MSEDNAAPILSREEIGELKMFITAHRALAGTRVNDILYSHEAQREEIQRLTENYSTLRDDLNRAHETAHKRDRDEVQRLMDELSERNSYIANYEHATKIERAERDAELSALRAELAEAKDTLKEHEEEHWCFNAEHGQVIIERDRLRAELEAVKAAEGELEVWLCPVHKSLDESRKLEPLDNCIACIRAERNELRVRLEEAERDTKRLEWLESKWVDDESSPLTEYEGQWHADGMPNGPMTDDMRSAIDAAISQAAQPEEKREA